MRTARSAPVRLDPPTAPRPSDAREVAGGRHARAPLSPAQLAVLMLVLAILQTVAAVISAFADMPSASAVWDHVRRSLGRLPPRATERPGARRLAADVVSSDELTTYWRAVVQAEQRSGYVLWSKPEALAAAGARLPAVAREAPLRVRSVTTCVGGALWISLDRGALQQIGAKDFVPTKSQRIQLRPEGTRAGCQLQVAVFRLQ